MSSIEQYNYKEVYDDSLVTATVTGGFMVDRYNENAPVTKVHLDIKTNPDSTSTGPIELKRLDDQIKNKELWVWYDEEAKYFRKKNNDTDDTVMNHLGEKTPITVTTPEEKELRWMADTIRKVMNDGKDADIDPPVELKRKTDHLEDTIAKLHHQIRHLEDRLNIWRITTLVLGCVILGYVAMEYYITYFMK